MTSKVLTGLWKIIIKQPIKTFYHQPNYLNMPQKLILTQRRIVSETFIVMLRMRTASEFYNNEVF